MTNHHKKQHKTHHINAKEIFKHKFVKEFLAFKHDADGFARGAISFSGSWKDWLGIAGLSGTFVIGGTILSAVALVGLVSSVASLGIGLAIALAAIGAEVGYTLYRSKKKSHEFHRASYFLSGENVEDDIEIIANLLANLYQTQLNECKSKEDAEGLALAHLQAIQYELMKNTSLKYDDLLHPGSLQAILAKNALHISKKSLHMKVVIKEDCNVRSLVTHPALFCEENNKFYMTEHSRPEKYGVIMFSTKQELDDFRIMSEKLKNHNQSWKYSKVRSAETHALRHGKFFTHYHTQHKVIKHAADESVESSFDCKK